MTQGADLRPETGFRGIWIRDCYKRLTNIVSCRESTGDIGWKICFMGFREGYCYKTIVFYIFIDTQAEQLAGFQPETKHKKQTCFQV
ncbi:hypothetical protein [Endozoicomonas lisbonensis]|uniref:Transposase DDE domain-containing protein n=1 Tax=Endozoicomonas lisbonensis TaxID=3120522 RepID=A0ABV2SK73_9GAMM